METIRLILSVCVTILLVNLVTSDTVVELRLISYTNLLATKRDGTTCCDVLASSTAQNRMACLNLYNRCDYTFFVCIGTIRHADRDYCDGILKSSGIAQDAGRLVRFTPTPMVFNVNAPWPQNLSVYVEDIDVYYPTNQVHMDRVDEFSTTIIQPPALRKQDAHEAGGTLRGKWLNSSLAAAVRVYCANHFYGSDCSHFCQPHTQLEYCDPHGQIQCYHPGKNGSCTHACDPDPCQHHGMCTHNITNFWCHCHSPWRGSLCDLGPCHSNPCVNNGTCTVIGHYYRCQCPAGYGGKNCQINTTPCGSNPCQNGGLCLNHGHSYKCECQNGSRGSNCQYLSDFCNPQPCTNGGACHQNGTHYWCVCLPGWTGDKCGEPLPCQSQPCQNGAKCRDLSTKEFDCTCSSGWRGRLCDKVNVTNTDCHDGYCSSSMTSTFSPATDVFPSSDNKGFAQSSSTATLSLMQTTQPPLQTTLYFAESISSSEVPHAVTHSQLNSDALATFSETETPSTTSSLMTSYSALELTPANVTAEISPTPQALDHGTSMSHSSSRAAGGTTPTRPSLSSLLAETPVLASTVIPVTPSENVQTSCLNSLPSSSMIMESVSTSLPPFPPADATAASKLGSTSTFQPGKSTVQPISTAIQPSQAETSIQPSRTSAASLPATSISPSSVLIPSQNSDFLSSQQKTSVTTSSTDGLFYSSSVKNHLTQSKPQGSDSTFLPEQLSKDTSFESEMHRSSNPPSSLYVSPSKSVPFTNSPFITSHITSPSEIMPSQSKTATFSMFHATSPTPTNLLMPNSYSSSPSELLSRQSKPSPAPSMPVSSESLFSSHIDHSEEGFTTANPVRSTAVSFSSAIFTSRDILDDSSVKFTMETFVSSTPVSVSTASLDSAGVLKTPMSSTLSSGHKNEIREQPHSTSSEKLQNDFRPVGVSLGLTVTADNMEKVNAVLANLLRAHIAQCQGSSDVVVQSADGECLPTKDYSFSATCGGAPVLARDIEASLKTEGKSHLNDLVTSEVTGRHADTGSVMSPPAYKIKVNTVKMPIIAGGVLLLIIVMTIICVRRRRGQPRGKAVKEEETEEKSVVFQNQLYSSLSRV